MKSCLQILSISFMLALASVVSAQVPCGIVDIDGPATVDVGTPVVLKAKVSNTPKPEFKWSVSAGTIIKGQSTNEITVDTTGLAGLQITATVELLGAPLGCKTSSSRTTQVTVTPLPRCAFDSYGDIDFEDEKARLDNLAIQIINYPQSSALIQMYAGQKTFVREATDRLDRAK